MKIDWFTIAAQAVNFIILVWLMRRFLYKPIIKVIDEREKRIATDLENAKKKQADAQKKHDEFEHKNEEFDRQRSTLFKKAVDEVQTRRQKLLDEARTAAETLGSKQRESLRNEADSLRQEIGRRIRQEVFAIVRKTLMDLADVDLEDRLGSVFVNHLREMDDHAKAEVITVKNASESVHVRSAFDLPATLRDTIQNAVNETFSAKIDLQFEIVPDLIAGIELNANGHAVAWSIAEYLSLMEKGIDDILEKNEKRATTTENDAEKPELEVKA